MVFFSRPVAAVVFEVDELEPVLVQVLVLGPAAVAIRAAKIAHT